MEERSTASKCLEQEAVGILRITRISPKYQLPPGSENPVEVEGKDPEAMKDTEETGPSKHNRTTAHVNSKKLKQLGYGLHRVEADGILGL